MPNQPLAAEQCQGAPIPRTRRRLCPPAAGGNRSSRAVLTHCCSPPIGTGFRAQSVAERSGSVAVTHNVNRNHHGRKRPVANMNQSPTPRAHRWQLSATAAVTCRNGQTVAVQSEAEVAVSSSSGRQRPPARLRGHRRHAGEYSPRGRWLCVLAGALQDQPGRLRAGENHKSAVGRARRFPPGWRPQASRTGRSSGACGAAAQRRGGQAALGGRGARHVRKRCAWPGSRTASRRTRCNRAS